MAIQRSPTRSFASGDHSRLDYKETIRGLLLHRVQGSCIRLDGTAHEILAGLHLLRFDKHDAHRPVSAPDQDLRGLHVPCRR